MRRLLTFCALIIAATLALVPPAAAQQEPVYPDAPPIEIEDDEVVLLPSIDDDNDVQVLGEVTSRGDSLPVTGGDVVGLAAIGVGAIAIGVVLVLSRRRMD